MLGGCATSAHTFGLHNKNIIYFCLCQLFFRDWCKEKFIVDRNLVFIKETNGFTEGVGNNKILILKRCVYGFRNFERFRNRILHIFNKKTNLATSC